MTTVALVGGAHIHTPSFANKLANAHGIETKYVWDPDRSVAEARQAVTGGRIVADPQTIFADPQVQAVVICSQTNRHQPLVLAAAAAAKAMFVEKPLGMNAQDAQEMAAAVEKAGVIFQTGYFMRSQPAMRFLRQAILAGAFGRITRLRLSNCHAGSLQGWFDTQWAWMADPAQAGCGAFGDMGAHVLDLLMWLNDGDAVVSCTAAIGVATGRYGPCDEFGEAMVRFRSGAVGTIAAGWVDLANPHQLEISGTRGHARLTDGKLFLQSERIDGADGKQPFETLPEPRPHAFDLFLEAIRGRDDAPLVTAKEAAMRNSVMEAIYRGAQSDQWVEPQ